MSWGGSTLCFTPWAPLGEVGIIVILLASVLTAADSDGQAAQAAAGWSANPRLTQAEVVHDHSCPSCPAAIPTQLGTGQPPLIPYHRKSPESPAYFSILHHPPAKCHLHVPVLLTWMCLVARREDTGRRRIGSAPLPPSPPPWPPPWRPCWRSARCWRAAIRALGDWREDRRDGAGERRSSAKNLNHLGR